MAPLLAPIVKSTARFLRLFEMFPPVPPDRRPPEGFQFRPWDTAMTKALKAVYDWRSKALHTGIPFPPAHVPPAVLPATLIGRPRARRFPALVCTISLGHGRVTRCPSAYISSNTSRGRLSCAGGRA